MAKKSVLFVEDEDLQRRSIHRQLDWSGFDVESAGDAAGARRAVEARAEPFDVVVLDMRLDKDDRLDKGDVTGADLGLEFRQRKAWRSCPAEFLINSAYSEEAYYKQALKLGAAAYLHKRNDLTDVVDHVRVLALRRALSVERPGIVERIRSIALSSRSRDEAIDRFCSEVVCAELLEALPLDHLVLLTEPGRTRGFSSRRGLPEEHAIYETLQALTHGKAGWAEPFVLEATRSTPLLEQDPLLRVLDLSAFVPFSLDGGVRLSIGLLPAASEGAAGEAERLVQLIGNYLRPSLLRHLVEVTAAFAQLEQQRRDVLRLTARDCLYLGQEVAASLSAAIDLGEIGAPGTYVRKLEALAADLTTSGEMLGELVRETPAGQDPRMVALSMSEVVARAWEEVSRPLADSERKMLDVEGDCLVSGWPDHLHLAVSRLLKWLVQRRGEVPAGQSQRLAVRCEESAHGPSVVFEDRSPRLPKRLRDRLLEPFSSAPLSAPAREDLAGPGRHLALYLAKALVEEGCLGLLEDRTDEMAGDLGHRLVMRLPAAAHALAA